MERKQKEIAEVGAIKIVQVAFGILREHDRALIPIQLAFGLPCFILSCAFEILQVPHSPPLPPASAWQASPTNAMAQFYSNMSVGYLMQNVMLKLLKSVIIACLGALSTSAIIHAVGLVFTDNVFSFSTLLKSSLQGLWKRLAVTLLYLEFLGGLSGFVYGGLIFFIAHFQLNPAWIWIPAIAHPVVRLYIAVFTMVAAGGSVLDEDYGWAALTKARKMLKGKFWVALRLQLLLFVLVGVVGFLGAGNAERIRANSWDLKLYLWTGAEIASFTFLGMMISLWNGVAYVSFKAHHGESLLGSSSVENGSEKDGLALAEV